MTTPRGEIAVNPTEATQTYNQTQGALRDYRDQIPTPNDKGIDDPTISKALREHTDKTKGTIDDTDSKLDKGKRAAAGLADTDRDSAARTNRNLDPKGIAALRDALSRPAGPASPFAQAPTPAPAAMPPPMPAPAPPMPITAAPGVFNVAPEALARLLAGADLNAPEGAMSGSTTGGVAGGRQPLRDADMIFKPTGLTLTDTQVRGIIEKALDNNGISRNPAIRAEWHELLWNQFSKESSHVPDAINRTDSNAQIPGPTRSDGGPAEATRGLGQVKPSTFAAYHIGGTSRNIFDPEANASAAVAYMMTDYHVAADGTGLAEFHARRRASNYGGY